MRSDYERLVMAKKLIEIKDLEIEALKEEVQKQFRLRTKAEIELKIERNKKEKMTPEEKQKIKSELYVQQQNDAIKNARAKLKECETKYEKVHKELVQVKMKLLNEK